MSPLARFLSPDAVSLKICGVTTRDDALRLADLGVDALGVNFWPPSKRHLDPHDAGWLRELDGRILRIGVFVNQESALPLRLIADGLIDVVQIHGDETPDDARIYQERAVPFIKGIGVRTLADLDRAADYHANAILLDAHAPGVYGGTGETFDWNAALDFKAGHPGIPLVLAGGITPLNAAHAAQAVQPAALDVASGAEVAPGMKDLIKVAALLKALNR